MVQEVQNGEHFLASELATSQTVFFAPSIIKDVYLHVPIHPARQSVLSFAIGDQGWIGHFQFVALPFGLASAPRVFTKIMAEPMGALRQEGVGIVPYLDDFLLWGWSAVGVWDHVRVSVCLLDRLGWTINWGKVGGLSDPAFYVLGLPSGFHQIASTSSRGQSSSSTGGSAAPAIPGMSILQTCHDAAGSFRSCDPGIYAGPGSFEGSAGVFA